MIHDIIVSLIVLLVELLKIVIGFALFFAECALAGALFVLPAYWCLCGSRRRLEIKIEIRRRLAAWRKVGLKARQVGLWLGTDSCFAQDELQIISTDMHLMVRWRLATVYEESYQPGHSIDKSGYHENEEGDYEHYSYAERHPGKWVLESYRSGAWEKQLRVLAARASEVEAEQMLKARQRKEREQREDLRRRWGV